MNLYDILSDSSNLNITINAGQLRDCIDYAVSKKIEQQKLDGSERMLTTEEACKMAQVSRPTLHRWKAAGLIPYVKIGKSVRYRHSDLLAVLNNARINGRRA